MLSLLVPRIAVPRITGPRTLAALLACGGLAGACSATYDFTECYSPEDCADFFEDGRPMVCVQKVCQVQKGGCKSNSQCEGLGEDFICTNSTDNRLCVSTASEQCGAPIYPDGEVADDVVFVGLLVPKTGADAALGAAAEKAALAAIKDFNARGTLQDKARIAAVVCDTQSSPTAASAAAKHLGDTLTIPVLIGPLDDIELTTVVKEVTFAKRVFAFTMGPMTTAEMETLDSGDLVFSAMGDATYQGAAMGAWMGSDFASNPDADAYIMPADNVYGLSLYGGVATDPAGSLFRIPQIGGGQYISTYKSTEAAIATLDGYLGDLGVPSALVLLGRSEVGEILAHYKATGMSWPEKIYVPSRAMGAIAALADPTLAGVVIAVGPDLEAEGLAVLRDRTGDPNLPGEAVYAYDATMSSLLAMSAVKAGSLVVGPAVSKAVSSLADLAGVEVRFADSPETFVPAATGAFAAGERVNVTGLSGPLDFDAKGDVCGPMAAYTLDASGGVWQRLGTYTPNCPDTVGTWAM